LKTYLYYNSYELIAAAAAYEAVNIWEKKQKEEGNEVHHATAKKLIASLAAKEVILHVYLHIHSQPLTFFFCIYLACKITSRKRQRR
jgi:hypothetical protein